MQNRATCCTSPCFVCLASAQHTAVLLSFDSCPPMHQKEWRQNDMHIGASLADKHHMGQTQPPCRGTLPSLTPHGLQPCICRVCSVISPSVQCLHFRDNLYICAEQSHCELQGHHLAQLQHSSCLKRCADLHCLERTCHTDCTRHTPKQSGPV